jgi:hypothetical protein
MTQRALAAGFKPQTIHQRMRREGLSLDEALKIPLRKTGAVGRQALTSGLHRTTISHRMKRYGLTLEQASEPHSGACQCCGDRVEKRVADHNHATSRFRGWLCDGCNWGLGNFKDSPERLRKAIAYLRKHSPTR